jgi:hypothetical protein
VVILKEVHNVTFKLCSFISFTVAHLTILLVLERGCSNVVNIVTRLLTGQSGVQIPAGQEIYLFQKRSRLTLGPAQPAIKWVTRFLPWRKWLGCDVYPPPSSIEVKNELSTPAVCLHGMNRANITFISS